MGKKAKNASGQAKAMRRKVDKANFPPPPVPVEEEVRRLHSEKDLVTSSLCIFRHQIIRIGRQM